MCLAGYEGQTPLRLAEGFRLMSEWSAEAPQGLVSVANSVFVIFLEECLSCWSRKVRLVDEEILKGHRLAEGVRLM